MCSSAPVSVFDRVHYPHVGFSPQVTSFALIACVVLRGLAHQSFVQPPADGDPYRLAQCHRALSASIIHPQWHFCSPLRATV